MRAALLYQKGSFLRRACLYEEALAFLDAVSITELPDNVNTSAFASALGACELRMQVHDRQANDAASVCLHDRH
jgi:hypothetical protein